MIRATILAVLIAIAATVAAHADALEDARKGNEAFGARNFTEAVEAFTRAINSGELSGEALAITYNNRGVAQGELGDFEKALDDYAQALVIRPNDETTLRNVRVALTRRGFAYASLGETEKAMADYDQAIEIAPDAALPYLRRGQLLADQGQLDRALQDLEQAQRLEPGNREIETKLSEVRQRLAGSPASPAPPQQAAEAEQPPATPPAAEIPEVAQPLEPAPAPSDAPATAEAPAIPEEPEATPPDEAEPPAEIASPATEEAPADGQTYRTISAVNYRTGPSNSAQRLGTFSRGTQVNVIGQTRGWMHIVLANGQEAYVYGRYLEPVGQ